MKTRRKRVIVSLLTILSAFILVLALEATSFAGPKCYYVEDVEGEVMIPTGYNCYYMQPGVGPVYLGATTTCDFIGVNCVYRWCDISLDACAEGLAGK